MRARSWGSRSRALSRHEGLTPPVLRPARGQPHRRGLVLVPEVDSSLREVVGRQLEADPVPGEDRDPMLPHLARHVGDHRVPVLERHTVARVGDHLLDGAFHFNQRLFCHVYNPLSPYMGSPRTTACGASNYPWEKGGTPKDTADRPKSNSIPLIWGVRAPLARGWEKIPYRRNHPRRSSWKQ